jgi:hypothetical protein
MELVIPEGAQVHITVGHPPLLALPAASPPQALPEALPPRRGRPLLRGTLAIALLAAAFIAGRHTGAPPAPIGTATAALTAPNPGPRPVERAFPDRALPHSAPVVSAQGEAPTQVPAALAEQLRMPPTMIPPPGQVAASANAPNPFGLHE